MNAIVKDLVRIINNHPGKADFLKALKPHGVPQFRPDRDESLEAYGAKAAYESGRQKQFDNLIYLLEGEPRDR